MALCMCVCLCVHLAVWWWVSFTWQKCVCLKRAYALSAYIILNHVKRLFTLIRDHITAVPVRFEIYGSINMQSLFFTISVCMYASLVKWIKCKRIGFKDMLTVGANHIKFDLTSSNFCTPLDRTFPEISVPGFLAIDTYIWPALIDGWMLDTYILPVLKDISIYFFKSRRRRFSSDLCCMTLLAFKTVLIS